ncbi:MAG: M16 family metallopeptidase [Candidatus Bipolaricaulia bacterium]
MERLGVIVLVAAAAIAGAVLLLTQAPTAPEPQPTPPATDDSSSTTSEQGQEETEQSSDEQADTDAETGDAEATGDSTSALSERTLDNGLNVIVYEDHTAPVVAVNVWYHVGSRNEPRDKQGMAHMLEHMMFKGSKNIAPEEHAKLINQAGGSNNAFTREDVTVYFETLPQEKLELALRLEAERMQNLIIAPEQFKSERKVVKEEFRARLENNPTSRALQRFRKIAFEGTPYAWTAAGNPEDLDNITVADLKRFYDTYYVPNNAALVIAGDVEPKRAFELTRKHFSDIPRGKQPEEPDVAMPTPEQMRTEQVKMPVQLPAVIGGYPLPEAGSEAATALQVAGTILSQGESSRLKQSIVRDQGLAVAAGGVPRFYEDLGMMLLFAFYTPGQSSDKVQSALLDEIAKLRNEPVGDRELQKAKNQLKSQYVFNLDSINGVANAIGEAEVIRGDAQHFLDGKSRYEDVTAEDVQRVAQKYLTKDRLTLVQLVSQQRGGSSQ